MAAHWNRIVAISACCLALGCNSDPPTPSGGDASSGTGTTDSTSDGTTVADSTTGNATDDTATMSGTTGTGTTDDGGSSTTDGYDPNEDIPPTDEEGCHAVYAQDHLPTFEIEILPVFWEQLMWEWDNGAANDAMGLDPKPYHSLVEFRYRHPTHDEDVVITDAAIRLKGNPDFWDPIPGDKMQFQIGFHTQDPEGRFLGLMRLSLDAATFNRHMLRDRLSYRFMRAVGVRAPCANNARLVVNGEYYGIFTNAEKMDEIYLQRAMEDPTGDLWKRANWELKTNEDTATEVRLDAMRDSMTFAELDQYLDIEQALLTFASEAVIPNSDGPWAGGLNGYYYDDPKRGKFMLLPWDLDATFERFNDPPDGEYPVNPDPLTYEKRTTHGRPFYDLALSDPATFDLYIDTIDQILHEGYDPVQMLAWVDEMSAQIEQAVLDDVNKPYPNSTYYNRLEALQEYIPDRYDFVDQWLVCWQNGGVDDGTGAYVRAIECETFGCA